MKLPACRKALKTHLRPLLKEVGFKAEGRLSFTRSNSIGIESLKFPGRRESDRCLFSGNLGLSIQAVEKILRPDSEEPFPTIWTPIHFLHTDRDFFEWVMRADDDAPSVASAIMEEVHTYVLPFFEEYTNIETIKCRLESIYPRDWFGMVPDQRVCVLAALEYLERNTDRAFEVLEDAIAAESVKPIPRNRPMKKLLADLRGSEALPCV